MIMETLSPESEAKKDELTPKQKLASKLGMPDPMGATEETIAKAVSEHEADLEIGHLEGFNNFCHFGGNWVESGITVNFQSSD